jgi:tetratricopeptide (TPR) repeat protein
VEADIQPVLVGAKFCVVCAGVVFLVALTLYVFTLAPTVTFVDSGELIVAARSLGVAHPPGFPLWIMLAHLASLLPFRAVAWRVNFSSAIFAAMAAAVASMVIVESLKYVSLERKADRGARKTRAAATAVTKQGEVFLPALTGGLLLAFSRTLWSYATVTEVYALNTLLIVTIFYLALRWRRGIVTHNARRNYLTLYGAATLFGLALGVHHVTVALTLPALAFLVYRAEGLAFYTSRRLLLASLCSVAALTLVYSYLPVAAARMPVIDWGSPRTIGAIWAHLTGRQYQSMFAFTAESIARQATDFARLALHEFGWPWLPVWLVGAMAGFTFFFRNDRTLFWFLQLVLGFNLTFGLIYDIAEDKDAYYLPTFACLVIASAAGLRWLMVAGWWRSRSYLVGLLGLLIVLVPFGGNWPRNNRRHFWIARDYVNNILRAVEPRGLLLTSDWQVASPMFYSQHVQHRRPDAKVVDTNLLRRSWYIDYLRRVHPDFIARSAAKVDAFLIELKQWERNEAAYASGEARTRINTQFEEMITSMVREEMVIAPVYVTLDLLAPAGTDKPVTNAIQQYGLVPQGLVFKLSKERNPNEEPRRIRMEMRGLNDGTVQWGQDSVVSTKVFPVYTTMMFNRGRCLEHLGRYEEAAAAFKEALALNPRLEIARRALEDCQRQLQPH